MTTAAPATPDAHPATTTRTPWWIGAVAGLVAAVCGLAVAELVAGLWTSLRSPVVSVGDRVVDNVPRPLKNWAISTFGTNDKAVLLAVVAILLAVFAASIGVLAVRRGLRAGLAGVGAFTLVGVLASLGRGGSGAAAPLPSLVGGVVAGGVLALLMHRGGLDPGGDARPTVGTESSPASAPGAGADRPSGEGAPGTIVTPAMVTRTNALMNARIATANRRQFLGTAGGLALAAAVVGGAGRWLREQGAAAAERLKVVLPRATTPLPAPPAGVSVDVPAVGPFFTPNADFYRIDTALTVPSVDLETWTLTVMGQVDRHVTLTYEDLLARPMIEADVTLACVSNEIGGDLVGNARWLGCRLDDLLDDAGIGSGADQVLGRSVDGFTAGFPTALLDGRDAIVAVGMNGEVLPTAHGFPARLVVPGVYGYVSATKWLSEIELTTFDATEGYWIPRGWAVEGPIKTQSRIDVPRTGADAKVGERGVIAGVAWAPTRGISRVEVQIDDGEWQEATLGDEYSATTWRQWKLEWTPRTTGRHVLRVRATDGTGETQTDQVTAVAPDGASGWHTVGVQVA